MQKPYNMSLYPGTGCVDGRRGDHLIIAPAYNVTADEIQHIVETTAAVVTKYFGQLALNGLCPGPRVDDRSELDMSHKLRR